MMELVDMLVMSPLDRIFDGGHPTKNRSLMGLFCDPKVRIPKLCVGVLFCMRSGRFRGKGHLQLRVKLTISLYFHSENTKRIRQTLHKVITIS